MEQAISIEQRIKEVLTNDPLFLVIQETPNEQHFLSLAQEKSKKS